jgi:hypothetical protein
LCKYSNIEREARRFRDMGLVEDVHFTVKMPEEGHDGYVRILREGLAYAAWLSVYGSGMQRELAAEFVKYILQRAWEEGEEVYEKAKKIVEEGKARGSLRLESFERKVEVNGKEHLVKVIGWGAEFEKSQSGKKLLKIRITAEVDGVRREYTITFSRYGRTNTVEGFTIARADAPRRQRGRRREVLGADKGPNGQGAEDTPHERRQDKDSVLRGTSGRLQALRRACRSHREVARGDKPPKTNPLTPRHLDIFTSRLKYIFHILYLLLAYLRSRFT